MRNIHYFLICFFIIGIDFTHAETLKIASIDWCPQLCPGTENRGYVMDTVEVIFEASPYEVEIRTYPWSRAIFLVRTGKAHALLAPAKAEAPDLLYPESEIGIQRMCFFTKTDATWAYSGVESLKDLRIGIPYDASIEELNNYIAQNKKLFQFMPYNNSYVRQSLKKLDYGRIDTFLFSYNSTIHEIRRLGMANKYRLAGCVSSAKIYMAFSPDKSQKTQVQKMMKFFDEKMDKLKSSDQIKHIMSRYGLEEW